MSDYPKIELGQLTTTINGLWTGKKPPFKTVAVIRNTNFSKDCRLKMDDVAMIDVEERQFATRKLQVGDIIIEKSGGSDKQPVGRPVLFNIPEGDYSFSNFTSTLRVNDKSKVLPAYLHKFLYKFYLSGKTAEMQSKTTGLRNLDFNSYRKILIPVPDIDGQKRIVDELDLLSGIIDTKNAQLRDLDTLAQSIFYEMFGNPVTNDKGWPKKRIGELVHLYNGRAFKPTDWTESGLPIVRIQNLNSPGSPYNCYDGVVDEAYLLKGGELLYAWSGTPGTSFGAHIWKGEKAVLNQHIFKVIFDEKYLNKLYFLYQLNLSVSSLFDQTHGGVGLKHITKGTLENQLVPLPNMELQNSFAQKVLEIDSEKDRLKCSLLQTKALLESRMSAYFNTK